MLLGGSLLVAGVVAALYAACAHLDRLLAGASEIIESVLSGYSDLEEAADEQRADDDDGTDYGAAFWEVDISGRWTCARTNACARMRTHAHARWTLESTHALCA